MSNSELLLCAYPDRLAQQRGHFLLANGRAAFVDFEEPLADARYLVVADLHGRATATRILLASRASEEEVSRIAKERAVVTEQTEFDGNALALRRQRKVSIGAIVLESSTMPVPSDNESARLLAKAAIDAGVDQLPWSKSQRQFRYRAEFLKTNGIETADLSALALESDSGEWLAPFLVGKTALNEITPDDLQSALSNLVPWAEQQRIEIEAPTHFVAPTGDRHALDYQSEGAPVLAIRVQNLYGLKKHPAVAEGRLPLHLLSPAGRPIQITRDLPGFWAGSWAAVRSEMRGRYPKHVWPEDPANANPTKRAKPRGT